MNITLSKVKKYTVRDLMAKQTMQKKTQRHINRNYSKQNTQRKKKTEKK